MFKILGRTAGSLVEIAFQEKLNPSDFAALRDELGPLIDEFGKVRLLLDLSELEAFEAEGLWDETSFPQYEAVERVALVVSETDRARAEAVFSLGARETRRFAPGEQSAAWQWLSEGSGPPA